MQAFMESRNGTVSFSPHVFPRTRSSVKGIYANEGPKAFGRSSGVRVAGAASQGRGFSRSVVMSRTKVGFRRKVLAFSARAVLVITAVFGGRT